MENIKFEKIPALRVDLAQAGCPGFYVLIIPDGRVDPGYLDFYIAHDEIGTAVHMFGLHTDSDETAARIALMDGPGYVEIWEDKQ